MLGDHADFTADGKAPSKYLQSYLAGIKRIEKHVAFTRIVLCWAHFLTARDLFSRSSPFLIFAHPLEFSVNFGICYDDWLAYARRCEDS